MQTKGLRISDGDIGKISELIEALHELPDGTLEGLSEYDPSSVSFNDGKVIIKRPSTFGDPLTVNFPEGSIKNIARSGSASFQYKNRSYEIYQ
jgi:hypothetical protein